MARLISIADGNITDAGIFANGDSYAKFYNQVNIGTSGNIFRVGVAANTNLDGIAMPITYRNVDGNRILYIRVRNVEFGGTLDVTYSFRMSDLYYYNNNPVSYNDNYDTSGDIPAANASSLWCYFKFPTPIVSTVGTVCVQFRANAANTLGMHHAGAFNYVGFGNAILPNLSGLDVALGSVSAINAPEAAYSTMNHNFSGAGSIAVGTAWTMEFWGYFSGQVEVMAWTGRGTVTINNSQIQFYGGVYSDFSSNTYITFPIGGLLNAWHHYRIVYQNGSGAATAGTRLQIWIDGTYYPSLTSYWSNNGGNSFGYFVTGNAVLRTQSQGAIAGGDWRPGTVTSTGGTAGVKAFDPPTRVCSVFGFDGYSVGYFGFVRESVTYASPTNHDVVITNKIFSIENGSPIEVRTITAQTATVNTLTVSNGGILNFDPATDVKLTINSSKGFQIEGGGTVNIGTPDTSITSNVSVVFATPARLDVSDGGTLNIYGTQRSYTTVEGNALTGATSINYGQYDLYFFNYWGANDVILAYSKERKAFQRLFATSYPFDTTFTVTPAVALPISDSIGSNGLFSVKNITRNVKIINQRGALSVAGAGKLRIANTEILNLGNNSLNNYTVTLNNNVSGEIYFSDNIFVLSAFGGNATGEYLTTPVGFNSNKFTFKNNIFFSAPGTTTLTTISSPNPMDVSNNIFLSSGGKGLFATTLKAPSISASNHAFYCNGDGITLRSFVSPFLECSYSNTVQNNGIGFQLYGVTHPLVNCNSILSLSSIGVNTYVYGSPIQTLNLNNLTAYSSRDSSGIALYLNQISALNINNPISYSNYNATNGYGIDINTNNAITACAINNPITFSNGNDGLIIRTNTIRDLTISNVSSFSNVGNGEYLVTNNLTTYRVLSGSTYYKNLENGLIVDDIKIAGTFDSPNISSYSNNSTGIVIRNISASKINLQNTISYSNTGLGCIVSTKIGPLKTTTIDLSNSYFAYNTGGGLFVETTDDVLDAPSYVYTKNLTSVFNNTYGFRLSGSKNYLNPVNYYIYNSLISANNNTGLEMYNAVGSLLSSNLSYNKNYNVLYSVGNGRIFFDRLTSINPNNSFAPLTTRGGPILSAASPFGIGNDGSKRFNGNTDYLILSANPQFVMLGDFTIEFFINLSRYKSGVIYLDQWNTPGGSGYWQIGHDSNFKLVLAYNGANYLSAAMLSTNRWHHIAICRLSTNLVLYVNGFSANRITYSGQFGRNDNLWVAAQSAFGPTAHFPGCMSNLRIVNGTALYTGSAYTVPTTKLGSLTSNIVCLYQYPYGQTYINYLAGYKNNMSLSGISYEEFFVKDSILNTADFSYYNGPAMMFDGTNFKNFYMDNCIAGCFNIQNTRNFVEGSYIMNNCIFNNEAMLNGMSKYQPNTIKSLGFGMMNYNQVSGVHITYLNAGTKSTDTTIYKDNYVSERLTPLSRTTKLRSGSKFVALNAGQSTYITVFVRKSTLAADGVAYNGNYPRLMLKRNAAMGIDEDIELDNLIGSNVYFNPLAGYSPVVNNTGVLEFYVDCDGTQGWINVDGWSAI